MGSSGEGNRDIDSSVGGLVWVRRRNGKWWPGRILGSEELPEGCMSSPKSGTPVKLLGREDASVDWYNIEKSKRVKAFRCGEYDECIEKAKAAAANSSKKIVKNARKEDAILHALEIESAHLGKGHPDDDDDEEEEHIIEGSPEGATGNIEEDSSRSYDDSDSVQELSQSGVSVGGRRTLNDSEDDGTEGVKRMKGLGDLGMDVMSSLKRKRSQVAHVHGFSKRRNRSRTMAKVLESSAQGSVPVTCKASDNMIPEKGSADRLYDVPCVAEEKKLAGIREIGSGARTQSTQSNQVETSLLNDKLNEFGFSCSGLKKIHITSQRMDNGSSEWPIKGKRSRHLIKRNKQDPKKNKEADGKRDTYLAGTEGDVSTYRVMSESFAEVKIDECGDSGVQSKDTQRLLPCRKSRFTINPKYEDYSLQHHTAASSLFDVFVEVKASYCPNHLSSVSVKSKLSGQPIVGRPLKVEVLEDHEVYSSSCELGEQTLSQKRNSPTKSSKSRRNGVLTRKIKKLSSITGAHKRRKQEKEVVVRKLRIPSVAACVPLNVVFGRISAAMQ